MIGNSQKPLLLPGGQEALEPVFAALQSEILRPMEVVTTIGGYASLLTQLGNYANDGAAAAGGIPVLGLYRNGSVLMVRVA